MIFFFCCCIIELFLSTLSLRRATKPSLYQLYDTYAFLSTLSLRRATGGVNLLRFKRIISIHALLAESDYTRPVTVFVCIIFLSTLSLRRATCPLSHTISINVYFYPRSPCGERPADCPSITVLHCNFYPRSPCGERHHKSDQ